MKYVYVLMLLGTDHETGDVDWHEVARSTSISFEICIAKVVETTNILSDAYVKHQVYCEPAPEEENT